MFNGILNSKIKYIYVHLILRNLVLVGQALFVYYVLFVLNITTVELGFILGLSFIASSLASLAVGMGVDLLGTKKIFIGTAILESVGWFSIGFVNNSVILAIVYSYLVGLAYAQFTLYAGYVGETSHSEFGRKLGAITALGSLMSGLGIFLGSLIADRISFQILFVCVALSKLVSIIPLRRLEEKAIKPRGTKFGLRNHVYTAMKGNPSVITIIIIISICSIFVYAIFFYPEYVKERFNVSPFEVGLFNSLGFVIWTAFNYPIGRLTDILDRRVIASLGYLIMALAWLFFTEAPSLLLLYIVYGIYSIGNCMGYYLTTVIMEMSSPEKRGVMVGIMNGLFTLAFAVSSVVGGYLWSVLGPIISTKLIFLVYSGLALFILIYHKRSGSTG